MVENSNVERLRELYKKYDLISEDIFMMKRGTKNIPIITRTGIEKIQAVEKIKLTYNIEHISDDHKYCVVKCVGTLESTTIESYGESSPQNTQQAYTVAMAEKRAKARCVLQLAGFYKLGMFAETESEDFN